MDTKDKDRNSRSIGLRGGTETSHVRQSFSHGRTKAVTVEHKRKRVVVPKPGAGAAGQNRGTGARPAGSKNLSDAEFERRLKAVEAAKAQEANRQLREREATEARETELTRLRAEKDAAERQAREREIAEQRAAAAAAEEVAAAERTAARAKAGPRAAPAETPIDPAAAQAQAARAEAGKPVTSSKKMPERATPADDKRSRPKGDDDRRRAGKLTIARATNDEGRQRSLAATRRRQERDKRRMTGSGGEREKVMREVQLPDAITVQELANRMAERVAVVVKMLMQNGIMATQNESIDADTATLIVEELGHKVVRVSDSDVEDVIVQQASGDDEANQKPRPPVVTIMGHVDHGKTSLLDALRQANVVSGEAGGITQHIGAYQVTTPGGAVISFLDTPGHAAFTSMRARGANVTDIVVLVVAADDSVMPQTIEAISHAKAAGVPMIVAITKIDKHTADPNRVRTQLLNHEVVVEEMGGEVLDVEISAHTRQGLDTLLESIVLQAEVLELRANPERQAEGAVIEAKLDVGRGPVATVLVQKGTLKRGDIFVVGEQWGKVRALINDQGARVDEAGPSVPVEVLGINGTPEAGDVLNVVDDEARAREIASYRERLSRDRRAAVGAGTTLDQLLAKAKADKDVKELPIVIKSDVQGSAEAIVQALEKISTDEVRIRVLHSGVGAITESDVTLAEASGSPIIGFNVRANAPARDAANQKGVEVRYYSVIYNLVDDVKAAASGLLSPEIRETFIGYAKILQIFKVTGVGKVAGCQVTEGVARRSADVRLLRDNMVVHQGKLKTL